MAGWFSEKRWWGKLKRGKGEEDEAALLFSGTKHFVFSQIPFSKSLDGEDVPKSSFVA